MRQTPTAVSAVLLLTLTLTACSSNAPSTGSPSSDPAPSSSSPAPTTSPSAEPAPTAQPTKTATASTEPSEGDVWIAYSCGQPNEPTYQQSIVYTASQGWTADTARADALIKGCTNVAF